MEKPKGHCCPDKDPKTHCNRKPGQPGRKIPTGSNCAHIGCP